LAGYLKVDLFNPANGLRKRETLFAPSRLRARKRSHRRSSYRFMLRGRYSKSSSTDSLNTSKSSANRNARLRTDGRFRRAQTLPAIHQVLARRNGVNVRSFPTNKRHSIGSKTGDGCRTGASDRSPGKDKEHASTGPVATRKASAWVHLEACPPEERGLAGIEPPRRSPDQEVAFDRLARATVRRRARAPPCVISRQPPYGERVITGIYRSPDRAHDQARLPIGPPTNVATNPPRRAWGPLESS